MSLGHRYLQKGSRNGPILGPFQGRYTTWRSKMDPFWTPSGDLRAVDDIPGHMVITCIHIPPVRPFGCTGDVMGVHQVLRRSKWADLGHFDPSFRSSRPLETGSRQMVSGTRHILILFWTLLAGFGPTLGYAHMASKRQSAWRPLFQGYTP